jgi:hypothetical protein
MDAAWIRGNYRPIDCFQRLHRINGRLVQLDPFSYLQTKTEQRELVGTIDENACCHIKNLCGTYIRYKTGRKPDFVWRLHYLWYLQYLTGEAHRLPEVVDAMQSSDSGELDVCGFKVDFSKTHVTCSNVLADELSRMEVALHGFCRPEVKEYTDAFSTFLQKHGDNSSLEHFTKCRT